ncbi:MAG: LysR family transcriptional regulator [Clostridia bacterium]|nr:LysR family transcriptional regulator [Clostridia bacterium]
MDLLQLRYFYDSANLLSISKTAEKYGVPSTSVSASIRRLEEELGCKLFERLPNRILLNDKGIQMRDSMKIVFDELDNMLHAISDTADDNKEIKILVRAIRSAITEQVIRYKSRHAHARFKLTADFNENRIDDFDIIIDTENDTFAGYSRLPLCTQQIQLYSAANSPLCSRKFQLHQLAKEPFVVMSLQGNHTHILIESCKKAGFTPNIIAQVNDSACFYKIISSGVAIGVTGEIHESNSSAITAITPLKVSDFQHKQKICLYYKTDCNHGNVRRFVAYMKEIELF